MDKFCKLFETEEYGQLLLLLDSDDNGPRVVVRAKPPGLGVCSIGLGGWKDDDEGWDKAEKAFTNFSEAECRVFAEGLFEQAREFAGGE